MNQQHSCKTHTIKVLEENIGVNLHDLKLGHVFLDLTPKTQAAKGKADNLDFIEMFQRTAPRK